APPSPAPTPRSTTTAAPARDRRGGSGRWREPARRPLNTAGATRAEHRHPLGSAGPAPAAPAAVTPGGRDARDPSLPGPVTPGTRDAPWPPAPAPRPVAGPADDQAARAGQRAVEPRRDEGDPQVLAPLHAGPAARARAHLDLRPAGDDPAPLLQAAPARCAVPGRLPHRDLHRVAEGQRAQPGAGHEDGALAGRRGSGHRDPGERDGAAVPVPGREPAPGLVGGKGRRAPDKEGGHRTILGNPAGAPAGRRPCHPPGPARGRASAVTGTPSPAPPSPGPAAGAPSRTRSRASSARR